jgi:hypothetical protein
MHRAQHFVWGIGWTWNKKVIATRHLVSPWILIRVKNRGMVSYLPGMGKLNAAFFHSIPVLEPLAGIDISGLESKMAGYFN